MFTWAAHFLIRPMARMNCAGKAQAADLEVPRGAFRLGPVIRLARGRPSRPSNRVPPWCRPSQSPPSRGTRFPILSTSAFTVLKQRQDGNLVPRPEFLAAYRVILQEGSSSYTGGKCPKVGTVSFWEQPEFPGFFAEEGPASPRSARGPIALAQQGRRSLDPGEGGARLARSRGGRP